MMSKCKNSYSNFVEINEPIRHPTYYDLRDYKKVGFADMYYSIHGPSQEDEKLKQANLTQKFHANRTKLMELYEKEEYEQMSELLPESDTINAYRSVYTENNFKIYDNLMTNDYELSDDLFDIPECEFDLYPSPNTINIGSIDGIADNIRNEFFSLCISENDVEFLKKIILKNNYEDLFNLRQNRGLIEVCVVNNKEEICRAVLAEMKLDYQTILFFFSMMVLHQTINLINIFSEYGHKMELNYIITAIRLNYIEVVKYAILNNFDVQSAFDKCRFFQGSPTSSSLNELFILDGQSPAIDVPMLKLLESYNINITDKIKELFSYGSESNKLDLIKYCVENHKCDVNLALRISCFFGNIDIMIYLLQNEADVNTIREPDIRCQNIDMIQFLIKYNYTIPIPVLNSAFMVSFLHTNDLADVKWLLDLGANPIAIFNRESNMGKNPDRYGNLQADFNKKYELLNSHLEYIVSMGKKSHVKYLVDNYFDRLSPELNRLFIIGCANGQIEMVNYLLDLGADINAVDNLALKSACYFGQLDIVKLLIYKGIDLNCSENLFLFTTNGYPSNNLHHMESAMYTKLISNGNIFRNDIYQHGKQNAEIIKLLMENNVIVTDQTILEMLSVKLYSTELFAYLISSGIDINYTFKDLFTRKMMSVLEVSVTENNLDLVKFLLENKADVNINNGGPIKFAGNINNMEIMNLLVEYGAV